ncbi:MAG TPA: hypothetical protein VF476_11265 [Chitinophagaceae bacterium]
MGGVPSGGSTWKNILIGVLTTVVAYSIVNYIKDKKEKRKEKDKIKTETVEAWRSMTKYETISEDNFYAAYCNDDLNSQLESMIYEKEQLVKNYEIISNRQGVDENLASFASRAIGQANEVKKMLENYLADYKRVDAASPTAEQEYKNIDSLFEIRITAAKERDTSALYSTYRELVSKYGDSFSITEDKKEPTASDLEGKWKETGLDKTFNIAAGKTFTMTADNANYPGKWELNGNALKLSFDDGSGSIVFNIKRFNTRYIRFSTNNEPVERQLCRK